MAGFMKLQVWREKRAIMDDGTELPLSEVAPQEPGDAPFTEGPPAWWACYSAPGYMDRTDSVGPCSTPLEAARECWGLYGDDTHASPDRAELARFLWEARKEA